MKTSLKILLHLLSMFILIGSAPVWADDDLEGVIELVNPSNKSFVLKGITFYVTEKTDYDDGLKSFSDLRKGLKVEVDYKDRDGKRFAKEIELDD